MKGFGVVLCLLFGVSCGLKMAKLYKSSAPPLTSSTLHWATVYPGKAMPANAVPIVEGGPIWCIVEENGVFVPGAVVGRVCRAPFFSVLEKEEFDVLVSINGSSRLVSEAWDFQEAIPGNAISTPRLLLAYTEEEDGILAGYIDPREASKRAYYVKDGKVVNRTKGHILTEVEPTDYSLNILDLNEIRTKLVEEVYDHFTLNNSEPSATVISRLVEFTDSHIVYWGMGKGCVLGLSTTVVTPAKTFEIKWGLPYIIRNNRKHFISKNLPPYSYVNVTVYGIVKSVSEATYLGNLTGRYGELESLSRNMTGIHTSKRFLELRANYSSILSFEDHAPLNNTRPLTEILLHSSTTTTTTATPTRNANPLTDGGSLNHGRISYPAAILLALSVALLRASH